MTKISIQQLASLIPDSVFGSDDETKTAFVRLVFETISGRLADGESMDVPGLGRFHCTGDADNPLLFDQDKSFSHTANAPFASFRPEPLAAEVTESMLDATVPAEESVTESVVEEVEAPVSVAAAEPEHVVVESAPVIEGQPALQKPQEADATPIKAPLAPEPMPEPEKTPTVPVPVVPVYEEEPAENEEVQDTEEDAAAISSKGGSRFSSGFFCGFIAGLAVGAIAFLVYIIIDINRPSPLETEVETEITETEQMVDSLSILME